MTITSLTQEALVQINMILKVNCANVNALLSKAEALYGLGLFEKSMIQHYRGIKIRPDFKKNIFSKGIRYWDHKRRLDETFRFQYM